MKQGARSVNAPPFSKGQVNRAGVLLLELRERVGAEGAERALRATDEAAIESAREALEWWRSLHARPLSTVAANLRYHVLKAEAQVDGRIEVAQRLKRQDTLIGKLDRERGNVTQMQDIGGVRAVVPSVPHVYRVRRRLLKSWTIVRERDYIASPKDDGYRALHLVVRRAGFPVEVQLRTLGQDLWANAIEEAGRQTGIQFKFGEGSKMEHAAFVSTAALIAAVEEGKLSAAELLTAGAIGAAIIELAKQRERETK
jgi:ppGpp synthetase/RelA/SpoT-type nucleotidyltranferase